MAYKIPNNYCNDCHFFRFISYICKYHGPTTIMKYKKERYESPEAEELRVMLESTILSGNMEDPDDPGEEIDI